MTLFDPHSLMSYLVTLAKALGMVVIFSIVLTSFVVIAAWMLVVVSKSAHEACADTDREYDVTGDSGPDSHCPDCECAIVNGNGGTSS